MRLVRQVGRLEAAAAAAREAASRSVGLVWTTSEERVDAEALAAGEYIAVDMTVTERLAGVVVATMRERVTVDACDLGFVVEAGVRIGRVTAIDGSLVSWELLEASGDGAGGAVAR